VARAVLALDIKDLYFFQKPFQAMTLHCLNALRVIAEFIVVSSHLNSVGNNNKWSGSFGGATALMSFFFVLSGFVATHSQKTNGAYHGYLTKRLKKTYPFYFLMWILGLPQYFVNMYVGNKLNCMPQRWTYIILQPFCLNTLLGWTFDGSNIPSWYYSSLVLIWALYSCLDVKKWIGGAPLPWILALYIASLLLSYPFFIFDGQSIQQMPFLHAFEFFMGCAAAMSVDQGTLIRGEIPAILLIVYIAYACCTAQWPHIWKHSVINEEKTCDFWQHQSEHVFIPGKLMTVTSIVWVFVIQWLACSELKGDLNVATRILTLDVFKSLAKFSLHIYLSHAVTGVWLEETLRALNILDWFSKDFHILFVYCTSYACSIHIQPRLDAFVANTSKNSNMDPEEEKVVLFTNE
jgi:peptidoglycan/LPS O-acetylase OafA/YrhL